MEKVRNILIINVIITCISFNAPCQIVNKVTCAKDGLNGKVKRVTEFTSIVNPRQNDIERKDSGTIETSEYDIEGHLIRRKTTLQTDHDPFGRTLSSVYKYDKKGNLIRYTGYMAFGGTVKCLYDGNNKLVEETTYKEDGSFNSKERYTYVQGNLVRSEVEYANKKEPCRTNRYDYNGNVIENIWVLKNDMGNTVLTAKNDYTYNSNNELVEEVESNYRSGANRRITHKYKDGNDVEETHYWQDGAIMSKTIRKYDASNKLVQAKIYDINSDNECRLALAQTYEYVYDDNSKLVWKKETTRNPYRTGSCVEQYDDWDKHGNNLTKTTTNIYGTDKMTITESRKIEYYP